MTLQIQMVKCDHIGLC